MDHGEHSTVTTNARSQNKTLKWLGICLGIAVIAIVAVTVFNVGINSLIYIGVLLACPLMHFWMMKDGKHKH